MSDETSEPDSLDISDDGDAGAGDAPPDGPGSGVSEEAYNELGERKDAWGQRRSHKPTREEIAERIEFTAHMLSRQAYKSNIKRLLKSRYGVDARTCERYLSRARQLMLKRREEGYDPERDRQDAIDFWESFVKAGTVSVSQQFHAKERAEWLRGVRPPAETGDSIHPTRDGVMAGRTVISEVTEVIVTSREELMADLERSRPHPPALPAPANGEVKNGEVQ
jgi:hypothetical protein